MIEPTVRSSGSALALTFRAAGGAAFAKSVPAKLQGVWRKLIDGAVI